MSTGLGLLKKDATIKAPNIIPATKNKFHASFFQS